MIEFVLAAAQGPTQASWQTSQAFILGIGAAAALVLWWLPVRECEFCEHCRRQKRQEGPRVECPLHKCLVGKCPPGSHDD